MIWQCIDGNEKVLIAETIVYEKEIFIHAVDTDEDYRRHGLATILMEHLIKFAKLHGYSKIYGEISPNLPIGISALRMFYKKLGFETHMYTFTMEMKNKII